MYTRLWLIRQSENCESRGHSDNMKGCAFACVHTHIRKSESHDSNWLLCMDIYKTWTLVGKMRLKRAAVGTIAIRRVPRRSVHYGTCLLLMRSAPRLSGAACVQTNKLTNDYDMFILLWTDAASECALMLWYVILCHIIVYGSSCLGGRGGPLAARAAREAIWYDVITCYDRLCHSMTYDVICASDMMWYDMKVYNML